ncbi:MAG TPA: homogentisate phytyltransferase [Solirubrobacteraceae bacterium]|nr:homogentisate phytyltransferase [Solirubrobacteraceae bacterium]
MSSHAAAVRRTGVLGALGVLWRFSRPHTLIGTFVSATGLYLIAVSELPGSGLHQLFWVLVAGTGVNVAIVGINQLTDIEIDRINKPHLPLASGELSPAAAWRIVAVAAGMPLVLALTQGVLETAAVVAALVVGAAYSLPPVRLKRYPIAAALCIAGVRSAVVNLGMYGHFALAFGGEPAIPPSVWALTAFVLPFSFAIAVLKDVPDMEGDRRYRIATFTVRLGPERAARLGLGALVLAYLGMIVLGPVLVDDAQPVVLAASHAVALVTLLTLARRADPADPPSFTRFYMRVWALFFVEYALVPAAVLTASVF